MPITHAFVSAKADIPAELAAGKVVPQAHWNADHVGNGLDYINVKEYGALGDGATNDTAAIQSAIDAAFGTAGSPHGNTNYQLNRVLWFPAGNYRITSVLFTKVFGGIVKGAGRFATTIERYDNSTPTLGLFRTNGCSYMKFEDMRLAGPFEGICFELDWDNSAGANLQSNTFSNIYFDLASHGSEIGLRIANSGYMGSETLILNCFFGGSATADQVGLVTMATNALQQTIVGGNFQGLDIGIRVFSGSVNVIAGVGFQQSITWDIADYEADTQNTMYITGCRTESPNFLRANLQSVVVEGCHQTTNTPGVFIQGQINGTIAGCYSVAGSLNLNGDGKANVIGCAFDRSDWNALSSLSNSGRPGVLTIENTTVPHADANLRWKKRSTYTVDWPIDGSTVLERQYDLEATSATDGRINGLTVAVGDRIDQFSPSVGSSPAWVVTTAGTVNSSAVLTRFQPIESPPVTKTADFTVAETENWLINNKSGSSCTVTLPSASAFPGREIKINNYQAQTVISSTTNVVPQAGTAAAAAILAATAGKWARLVSNGTNWIIMESN
jgi:Pectate lyase superfamily protein